MDMAEQTHIIALRGTLKENEPMARHVSWRAGGAAARAYWPADLDDLAAFLKLQRDTAPIYLVGLGSNLLVRDGGFNGTAVFLHGRLDRIAIEERADASRRLFAEAGVASPKVARFAARHGMAGAEFLAGVPGTVGGALAMNAGCYGSETWQFVESVTTIDRQGELRERTPAGYDIGYRHVALKVMGDGQTAMGISPHSILIPLHPSPIAHYSSRNTHHPEEWFVAARFRFPDGDEVSAKQRIKDWLTRRIATQPLDQPNAGSTFRNPPGGYAAQLIESCGLKGFTIGGAQVSRKHANFIVNLGGATAADIESLIYFIHDAVRNRTGVDLVPEVRIIGEKA